MYSINITFSSLDEVTLYAAYGRVGIYVIWHGKSQIKPLRIGQGQILHRFASHVRNDNFYWPIFGAVGILGDENAKNINDAKIVESVLLHIADKTNMFPTSNKNKGEVNKVYNVLEKYNNLLKVNIKGRDPLLRASSLSNRPLYGIKTIEAWLDDFNELCFRHPWHTK